MPGQDGAQDDEQGGMTAQDRPQALSGRPEDDPQDQAGEDDPAEDDQERGKEDPLPEKPGQAEQRRGQVNLEQASAVVQAGLLPEGPDDYKREGIPFTSGQPEFSLKRRGSVLE